ncbi:DUF6273 domain-containing protein [Cohnella boryungensis]|uniref:DUF6273 domain-containing protein n=1 Tax=Cohnella boryungensis TaxID=768479 RepID=A0ABV8SGJ2_9BACL
MDKGNLAFMPHQSLTPGEVVTFGAYPQTADGTDRTPIKWRVLQNSDRGLFMLSEYILDCKRYHRDFTDITWHGSDLRAWLNNEFYHTAFTESEKVFIKTNICTDNGESSPDTEDKVFLLSASEVKELTCKLDEPSLSVKRRAIGTEYAKIKKSGGCHLYVYDKKVKADYITENGEELGCSWWWLRSQLLGHSSRAFFVGPRSSIRSYARVDLARDGVRPAILVHP